MRLFAVLLILASLPLSMAQPTLNSANIEIALEGANEVMMPSASLAMPGGDWTYPYESYPVYAPGQNISGSFKDPGREAGQKLGICQRELGGYGIYNRPGVQIHGDHDSAIALQESNTSSSSMYLITDSGWAPGKYILTCGVYTSRGITGIDQRYVELVP